MTRRLPFLFTLLFLLAIGRTLSGQQTLRQGFEQTAADNWPFAANPAPYNDVANEDHWTDTTAVATIVPASGNRFWYLRDLENPGGGGAFFHTLDFTPIDVSAFSANTVSFRYYTESYDAADSVGYIVAYDNGNDWNITNYVDLPRNTLAWTTVTINVPAGASHVRLRLMAKQNGGTDFAGWDDVQLVSAAADVVPPQVLSAAVINQTTLRVVFNEPLNVTAENLANYTGVLGLTAATRAPGGDTVFLTTATPFVVGQPDTLTVAAVEDLAGNALAVPYQFAFTFKNPDISFSNARVRVTESAGVINVPVRIENVTVPASQARVRAVGASTAVAGADYVLLDTTVAFTDTGAAVVNVRVDVLDDATPRDSRYLLLELYDFTDAQAGANALTTVLIADNDTEVPGGQPAGPVRLRHLTSFAMDTTTASAEISAYEPVSKRLFTTNIAQNKLEIIDLKNPYSLAKIASVDIALYGGGINSVAVANGVVAVAVDGVPAVDTGRVIFFDINGVFVNAVNVGALPDHLNFTPDGARLLVANEGEPASDYSVDPEGSVSIIDMTPGAAAITQANVTQLGFSAFNADSAMLAAQGIRIYGPGSTVAQDLEPEYITVSEDGHTAWVTLQENNAIAVIDLDANAVTTLLPLGTRDFSAPNASLDASDQAPGIFFNNWKVKGMYQPDAVATWTNAGTTYLITANEGDAREYTALTELVRLGSSGYALDSAAFPDAVYLKRPELLGRLNVTRFGGDTDGDGDYDEIHTLGSRSITIWNAATGERVWDSGDDFERITAADPTYGAIFNASNSNNTRKNRSDDKGPEPEGVALGVIAGRTYAFTALERIGGVMVYDVTNPVAPVFVQWINTRATGTAAGGDLGPEGILFIPQAQSPNGRNLVVVSNEISGTVSVFEVEVDRTQTADFGLTKYAFDDMPVIGVYGDSIREGGISGLMYRDGAFRFVSDRGPNADAINHPLAQGATALVFPFPDYAPKVWQVRPQNGALVVEDFDFIKRPDATGASGLPLPVGQGNTGEVAWADTAATVLANDPWGIDSEGLTQDNQGFYWVCDEYGTSIWKLDASFRVVQRFTPFPVETEDAPLDSLLGRRRANRGLEGVAYTPNGLVYAILQSPANNPNVATGNNSRIHRLVELDPESGAMRTFVYVHDPVLGEIRSRDWKIGDLAAVNNQEFLVLEHAERNGWNAKNIYKFNIAGATPVSGNDFGGQTLEQLIDPVGLAAQGIVPVQKELFLDLLELGWERQHDKPEGLAVVDDSTIAVINDNDFGIASPNADGQIVLTGKTTRLYVYQLPADKHLDYVSPYCTVSLGADVAACQGSALQLTAQGNDFTAFTWSDASTSASITVANSGVYSVVAENAAGCRSRDTVHVTLFDLPVVGLGSDTVVCAGVSVTFDAGNAGATFAWSTGDSTQTLATAAAGTYTVTVSDANGCVAADTVVLGQYALPAVELGAPLSICTYQTTTLDAGAGAAAFAWSNGAVSQTVNVGPGTYSVTVTSAEGCTATDGKVVNAAATPVVDLGADQTRCAGDAVTLMSPYPGVAGQWSTGSTAAFIVVEQSGLYALDVTFGNGCSDRDTVELTFNPAPALQLPADTILCEGDTLLLVAGPAGADYAWSTGAATASIEVLTAGAYTVTATNALGCTASATANVDVEICVGTEEPGALAGVRVFPNPTSGVLFVEMPALAQPVAWRLLSATGQSVGAQQQASGSLLQLDLTELPKAVYWLQLLYADEVATYRIVTQ